MNFADEKENDLLAGEYVLGTLSADDQREFEAELRRNPGLTASVARWQDRLLEVAPVPMPMEPARDAWRRIERALPGHRAARDAGGFWNSLAFWKGGSAVSALAAAVLAIRLVTLEPESVPTQYIAVLEASNHPVHWLVEISDKAVHLRPMSPVNVEPGKSLQFWTKPEGAAGPTSLGLVAPDRPSVIPLDRLPALGPNQLFEVTLEPQSGSPLGRPTGPILAVGKAVRL